MGNRLLEDHVRNGNHAAEVDRLPFVISPSPSATASYGRPDPQTSQSRRAGSFRFEHREPRQGHHWGSLAQRLVHLRPHTRYTLTFNAKGETADPSAFFVTADLKWQNQLIVEPAEHWRRHTLPFTTGDLDYTEIRFVIQAPGTFWITDVRVTEPAWRRGR